MKTNIIALILAALIIPSHMAAGREREPKERKERDENPKEEEEREKAEKAERKRKSDAIKEFLKQKDKNKDGSISRDEYLADESDKEAAGKKFDEFNKNGDRILAKSEIEELLGLSAK